MGTTKRSCLCADRREGAAALCHRSDWKVSAGGKPAVGYDCGISYRPGYRKADANRRDAFGSFSSLHRFSFHSINVQALYRKLLLARPTDLQFAFFTLLGDIMNRPHSWKLALLAI